MSKVYTDNIEKRTGGTAMAVPATGKWPAANIADDAVGTAQLSATGTASATTFLRGDNSWTVVADNTTQWQAVKTAAFTAVAGNGYPINTTGAEITVTLPASANVGDTIEFVDYAGTFDEYNAILDPQTLKINGDTTDRRLLALRQGVRIVYVDATQGWLAVTAANVVIDDKALSPLYSATGGTTSTYSSGGVSYKVHTFTTSGNFISNNVGTIDAIIVGGGGGGKSYGGGGGGGSVIHLESKPVTATTYAIVIAAGGTGSASGAAVTSANDGGTTTFAGYSATGGGGAAGYNNQPANSPGANSGGGGAYSTTVPTAGTAPSDTDAYDTIYGGNTGGAFVNSVNYPSGGGAGSGADGVTPANGSANGGNGGAGVQINIDGNNYYWGGGGAGSVYEYSGGNGGNGGIGGGGGGADGGTGGAGLNNGGSPAAGVNGLGGAGGANTGGGGGGGNHEGGGFAGGAGGAGIVIVRYIV